METSTPEAMEATPGTSAETKRKIESEIIDPDSGNDLPDPKRPKIDLKLERKTAVLVAIINGYFAIMKLMFPREKDDSSVYRNVSISSQVTSIIFTFHNINRQKADNVTTNAMEKSLRSDPKVHHNGGDCTANWDIIDTAWTAACEGEGLRYMNFSLKDPDNWYRTMEVYLNFFNAYHLRVVELRVGHTNMAVQKEEAQSTCVPVSSYGLSGPHHTLLEGVTYPPESRLSMARSVGPMTAILCMIRSTGQFRKKWELVVKKAFSHVEPIDDFIALTKTNSRASDIAGLISILADIALVTTSKTRQATRIHIPLCMFSYVYKLPQHGKDFLKFYSISGPGGFYAYKKAQEVKWMMDGKFTSNWAAQVCFHGIFGTFKEDFGVLSQITDVANWFTREQIGDDHFREATNQKTSVRFTLPFLRFYSKISAANQKRLLTSGYYQLSSISCFQGKRTTTFSNEFIAYLKRRTLAARYSLDGGKTIVQLTALLAATLEELLIILNKRSGAIQTTKWFGMEALQLNRPGEAMPLVFETQNIYFMGKGH